MSHSAIPRSRSASAESMAEGPLSRFLLLVLDISLAACLFLVPLMLGGRHPLGQIVLVAGSLTAALACTLRITLCGQRMVWSRAIWLFLFAILLGVLQVAPLPRVLIDAISPKLGETIPIWTTTSGLEGVTGEWTRISLTPWETRSCLVVFVAYGLLFTATLQRIRSVEDVERIVVWMAWAAVLMAIFAIVQLLTSNGKFFWFYEHPYGDTYDHAKGSFVNRNHFANFMAMGLGPVIWYLLRIMQKPDQKRTFGNLSGGSSRHEMWLGIWSLGLVLVLFGGLMSLSRGGSVAIFVAALVCVFMFYRAGKVSPKILVGLGGVASLVFAFLFVYGQQAVSRRLDDFLETDLELLDARSRIWAAVSRAIADFPLLGTGLGSHQEVNPIYLTEVGTTEYSHAESGYLQVWLESGTAGFLLLLLGIGLCAYWCFAPVVARSRDPRLTACAAALSGGLVANALHSCADFMWYIPGCTVVVILFAACVCRISQLAHDGLPGSGQSRFVNMPRPLYAAGFLMILLLGGWMIPDSLARWDAESHWNRYLLLALEKDAEEDDSENNPKKMIGELSQVLKVQPNHARARLRLARLLMIQFGRLQRTSENPMTIEQIRDAAQASEFASRAELDAWLLRAVGPHVKYLDVALKQTHRGLDACPVQGDGYLYLAKLGFLEGNSAVATQNLLKQALSLRPHDGRVLFGVGKEAFVRGDFEKALEHWKKSFHAGPSHQNRLIVILAGQIAAPDFITEFEPDELGLSMLSQRYRALKQAENLEFTLNKYGEALATRARMIDGIPASRTWLKAHRAFAEVNRIDDATTCAEAAVRVTPNEFDPHFVLGNWARKHEDYPTAAEHLTWCARRRPNNEKIQSLARQAQLNASTSVGQTATQSFPDPAGSIRR